ncbi:MAG: ribbon-helix-helix protein, CopG family [Armatimonadota bacterium]|nr:ribbon-helix-helix protein, CopG family [Armatimonadota bacterium]MDR7452055.1 ribbon-helix-helix protein, CopG family [Armatimonadota bacterium]MDR7466517.1 ribbon-helix-helix protein, CopG family [Armatimonadota bacterium]MDR7493239.1 ribbon-helix-helix protein, CopG family [Armatimonadota bacterium]MDR7500589.1 ribbon-helix-helix protein, CopG family [Armatimonadota bacterium]
MRRVQLQLDESTYEALRRRAFARRQSLAATVRELLRQQLSRSRPRRRFRLEDFSSIGAASVKDPYPVSEQHDRALTEDRW